MRMIIEECSKMSKSQRRGQRCHVILALIRSTGPHPATGVVGQAERFRCVGRSTDPGAFQATTR